MNFQKKKLVIVDYQKVSNSELLKKVRIVGNQKKSVTVSYQKI
jgi:hypothetical protein